MPTVRMPLVADSASARPERAAGARAPAGRRAGETDGEQVADGDLVERLAAGDGFALSAIYGRYGRPAYSLARRLCADDGVAEDVVQEVFLAVWRNPKRFDPQRGAFATWLLTLVHHKAVDAVRRESAIRRRTVPAAEAGEEWSPDPAPGADHEALAGVAAGQVRSALRRLPVEQRQALALAYYGGHTQREVAVLTGVPLGTVKSRMFAGVARLRSLLAAQLGADVITADFGGEARR